MDVLIQYYTFMYGWYNKYFHFKKKTTFTKFTLQVSSPTIWFFLIKYHIWGLNRIYSDLLLLNNKNNCLILKILTIINEMHIQYPFGIILLGVVVDERTQAYKNTGTLLRSHSTSKEELQISWFSLDDSSEIAWDAPYISIYRKHF